MIEFKSKLDNSKSKALNKMTFRKMLIWFVLLSVVIVAVGVIGIVTKEDEADFATGVMLVVLGVLFTPLCFLLTLILRKCNDDSTAYIDEKTDEVYTFDDEGMTISQECEGIFSANLKAKYSYIYKAREDKNYYYLYVSKIQSYVLEKTSITKGTLEEFADLLKRHLGEKFKSKNK